MPAITLQASTGVAAVDRAIAAVIGLIERRLPGRARGYYLVGSYAVGEAVAASDIDLLTVLKGEIEPGEREQFGQIRAECKRQSAFALDLGLDSEAKYFRVGAVWFGVASVLLYGEDIRALVPRKPVASHLRDLIYSMPLLLARVRGGATSLAFPLGYPEPAGALRGYDSRIRSVEGHQHLVTKDLVSNVLAVANALLLLQTREYLGNGRKRDIPEQYRLRVGGEWAALVEQVFNDCRGRWNYGLPAAPADREQLNMLCEQALAFENYFLGSYRDFLLGELERPDTGAQLGALRGFQKVVFADQAVRAAIRPYLAHRNAELRQAACAALEQIDATAA